MSATLDSGQPVSPTSKQAARILVVDHEQAIRRIVTTALTRRVRYTATANASQAIATCESESFDLLLSDVMMPGMNGHELAQWVADESSQDANGAHDQVRRDISWVSMDLGLGWRVGASGCSPRPGQRAA